MITPTTPIVTIDTVNARTSTSMSSTGSWIAPVNPRVVSSHQHTISYYQFDPTTKDWKFLKQRDFTADPVK